jgi:hypothetical protein
MLCIIRLGGTAKALNITELKTWDRSWYLKNTGVFEGVVENGFLHRSEHEPNVRGVSRLG